MQEAKIMIVCSVATPHASIVVYKLFYNLKRKLESFYQLFMNITLPYVKAIKAKNITVCNLYPLENILQDREKILPCYLITNQIFRM